jgi:hypothetical protein
MIYFDLGELVLSVIDFVVVQPGRHAHFQTSATSSVAVAVFGRPDRRSTV